MPHYHLIVTTRECRCAMRSMRAGQLRESLAAHDAHCARCSWQRSWRAARIAMREPQQMRYLAYNALVDLRSTPRRMGLHERRASIKPFRDLPR
jgi:hypothetical protein